MIQAERNSIRCRIKLPEINSISDAKNKLLPLTQTTNSGDSLVHNATPNIKIKKDGLLDKINLKTSR
jgi:hypothetical protein